MESGNLWISPLDVNSQATVDGAFTMDGGVIQFRLAGISKIGGTLRVTGNVAWNGGQFNPGYDATTPGDNTNWSVGGNMTIASAAVVAPVKCNGPTPPPTGSRYSVILADGTITGTPQNASVSIALVPVGTPVKTFDLVAP